MLEQIGIDEKTPDTTEIEMNGVKVVVEHMRFVKWAIVRFLYGTGEFWLSIDFDKNTASFFTYESLVTAKIDFEKAISQSNFIRQIFSLNSKTAGAVTTGERTQLLKERKLKLGLQATEEKKQESYNPEAFSGWKTTVPKDFDSSNFRFLVHAVVSDARAEVFVFGALNAIEEGVKWEHKSAKNVFVDPNDFLKRPYISCSIIDPLHRATWGTAGVILKVPEKNIICADSDDMGTIPNNEMYVRNRPDNANQVISTTDYYQYNEVLVSAIKPEKISFAGVFVVLDQQTGEAKDKDLASRAYKFAKQHNLPLIEFYEPFEHVSYPGISPDEELPLARKVEGRPSYAYHSTSSFNGPLEMVNIFSPEERAKLLMECFKNVDLPKTPFSNSR